MATLSSRVFGGLASLLWLSQVSALLNAHEHQHAAAAQPMGVIRSVGSGLWSAAATWEGGKVPGAGARVQVRTGHNVAYDVKSDLPIRMIHVAGSLSFASDKDTRLDVGLIKIQPGEDCSEDGFECDTHVPDSGAAHAPRPALFVGTPARPIDASRTAIIRLIEVEGVNKDSWPAIVCCGGQMDFHGAPLNRTWVKLGETADSGATTVKLAEPVIGWRAGDRILLTATSRLRSGTYKREGGHTEERTIKSVSSGAVTLDQPLEYEHFAAGEYRGEIANLSRNVVVESADPAKSRGHTMYHRGSAGSISYAEFRHLGKENTLGRYSLHYHLVGDTMRGSSVVGASIWDSGNRWLTIHGTNYLVVRDCVGYKSLGHGFFLEDGTEVNNVLDHNLAVQARSGKPLKGQMLPFDKNDGAGFWWANSLNTFINNVACDNEQYGYRFDAMQTGRFDLNLSVQQPDGSAKKVDIRTLPFVRFEDNECHSDGLYGMNLGEGVAKVGPDDKHPFIVRNLKIWGTHYAFRGQSPSLLLENLKIHQCRYGMYFPTFDQHVYRNITISETPDEQFSAAYGDTSIQGGTVTIDGLTFENIGRGNKILFPVSHYNTSGHAVTHIRNVRLIGISKERSLFNMYGGQWLKPPTDKGVPIFVHDHFGPGKHAKVISTQATDLMADGNKYREDPPFTGENSRVAEVQNVEFPTLLHPVDDRPPATIITHVSQAVGGKLLVRGTTADNGEVKQVLVNGQQAKATAPNFAQWEVVIDAPRDARLSAAAFDAAGNGELLPHVAHANHE